MKIGFIGVGAMGGAIAKRLSESGGASPAEIYLASKSASSARQLAAQIGANAVDVQTAAQCDIVILAVKPYAITEVASLVNPSSVIVSVAAGVQISTIEKVTSARILRVMPNIGATLGQSMSALCAGTRATQADIETVTKLFECIGHVQITTEKLLPAFTAIASCSLAWTFSYIEGLARGALAQGMKKEDAVYAAAAAVQAAATIILNPGDSHVNPPALMIDRVTSPGGTTIAGLIAAEETGLSRAAVNAVHAACKRDAELS